MSNHFTASRRKLLYTLWGAPRRLEALLMAVASGTVELPLDDGHAIMMHARYIQMFAVQRSTPLCVSG